MTHLWIKVLILILSLIPCAMTVTLSPTITEGVINQSITLVCSFNETGSTLNYSSWYTSFDIGMVGIFDQKCKAAGYVADENIFSWHCYENDTFSVTIKRVTTQDHGQIWICGHGLTDSNQATIFVKVPVESVTIDVQRGNILDVKENTSVRLTCISSYSHPASNVTWWLKNDAVEERVTVFNGIQETHTVDNYGLTSTKSELEFTVNRYVNSWDVFCSATNLKGYGVSSDAILLDVSYPPSTHPDVIGFRNDSTYSLLENSSGHLSCYIAGGNPPAILTWDCYNEGVSVVNRSEVVRTLTWVALRGQRRVCRCIAYHGTWHSAEIINVEILYQAKVQKFFIEGHDGQRTVTITENENLRFTCSVDSNPLSIIKLYFQWKTVIHKENNASTLTFLQENVSYFDAGVYTCTASNKYNRGQVSLDVVAVLVRCSPRIHPESDSVSMITAAQGSPVTFSIATLAYPEPGPSGFIWKKHNGSNWITLTQTERIKISSSELLSNLTISHVTASDYGIYKLIIRNDVGQLERLIELEEDSHPNLHRDTLPVTGIVLGSVIPIVAISTVLAIVIIRSRRKLRKKRDSNHEMTTTERSYDGLNTENQTTESTEKPYDEVHVDRDHSRCPVYTNLAL